MALKFRTKEVPAKDVLQALEAVKSALDELGKTGQLDPKLAEYAFFPLAQQVFNETRRLSSRCLEVAVECVTLLVTYGYRQSLLPELGKQLLVLMCMLAGAGPNNQTEPATDDLKTATFECIAAVIKVLKRSDNEPSVLDDQGTKNVVDQLIYLVLEAITDSPSDQVQSAASEVLSLLIATIRSRVFLASLLPRTVSSLIKALKPSTKARRTQKVLVSNLKALRRILNRTLSDRVAVEPASVGEKVILGESWLKATAGQIKNALLQVVKLRTYDSTAVRAELEELCVMVIEDCRTTLVESTPTMLETLVVLSAEPDGDRARSTTKHLVIAYPEVADVLRMSFNSSYQSLPRLMQGHDEQNKQRALQKLTATLQVLPEAGLDISIADSDFLPVLVNSIGNIIQDPTPRLIEIQNSSTRSINMMTRFELQESSQFQPFLLSHEGQRDTALRLQTLRNCLRQLPERPNISRYLVDLVADSDGISRLTSFWLALNLLRSDNSELLQIGDLLTSTDHEDKLLGRSSLLADLHATTLPLLAAVFDENSEKQYWWQLQALAMECLVMYAQTFEGDSYRPELMDTLYPVLSFLGSPNTILRSHAMTALNSLAQSCQYSSTTDLLIDNVDYLVNSVAWKLNTYSLSPEAPQILRMMVHLCGAQLIPYLDDLIQSIFVALDSYHGYPEWVEALFSTLKAIVDESVKQPQLAITQAEEIVGHKKAASLPSRSSDILDDLKSRKRRKLDFDRPAEEPPTKAPHRPWTDELDGPSFPKASDNDIDEELGENGEENDHLAPTKAPEDAEKKLSKPHQLLLSIATSTLPHLYSPSPQVRHLLLDLLKDISPLLSRDENSFLPLINAVWPVLVPRLFAEQSAGELIDGTETAYNICAAADTIAVLCEGAGDFMASRIEDISQQLFRLFRKVSSQVRPSKHTERATTIEADNTGKSIKGAVSLEVIKSEPSSDSKVALMSGKTVGSAQPLPSRELRTSQMRILQSLLHLLVVILGHVQLTLDTGDEVMKLLLPYLADSGEGSNVREVLEAHNADAVWLYETRSKAVSNRQGTGIAEVSVGDEIPLRQELRNMGFRLAVSTA